MQPTRGYLVVDAPTSMGVYISGVYRGRTGEQLEVDCGIKFLRLGAPTATPEKTPGEVVWAGEGRSANIACRAVTHIAVSGK